MNRYEIESLYEANGLNDYKLTSPEDLLKIHNINYNSVNGYDELDDLNKARYEKFIVNIYNAFGLESRATLIPKGIYYVEERNFLLKENPADECFLEVGTIIKTINKNGEKCTLHKWINEDYKNFQLTESEPTTYLRFEYTHDGRNEWLHIENENSWY